jgi:signal transduction histidine kinase
MKHCVCNNWYKALLFLVGLAVYFTVQALCQAFGSAPAVQMIPVAVSLMTVLGLASCERRGGAVADGAASEVSAEVPVIDYKRFLKNFSTALLTVVDLNKLCELIVNTLYDFYGLQSASIFLFSEGKDIFLVAYACGEQPGVNSIEKSNAFARYLHDHQTVLNKQTLDTTGPEKEIVAMLSALSAEMCIPLVFKDKLIGILNLGAKRSLEPYTEDDEEAFLTLESQISIAVNNAILFKVQKESQVLLAQKNKMDAIIALSSGINHEINNPLSIISMRCQNFLRKLSSGKFTGAADVVKNAQEVIESSLRNANRAHLITKRLANFAQPAGQKMNFQPLSIKDSVLECIDLIGKKQFFSDNITLNIDLPDSLSCIYADKVHFQQVLYNIIMNAYHAIERNGTISFKAYEKGRTKVMLEISDTGIGIPPENIDKIWEPFYTTKPTNPLPGQKATGSGLGLSLVKRYIEGSGGTVTVDSASHKGTVFLITLVKVTQGQNGE